jgi:DNA-binding NarL/FixJ family response regulator
MQIVVVADVRLYCEGLTAVLPAARVLVVGTAGSRDAAPAVIQATQPDAVLIDVTTPDALELMRQLRTDPPPVHIVAFGVADDLSAILACAEAGAAAYVPISAGVQELVMTLESVVAGEVRCPPRVAGELFRRASEWSRPAACTSSTEDVPVLTARQRQVLAMLRQSLSNKEIGQALHIAESTVKNHVHQLLDKLHVPNRAKAAACLPRPNHTAARSRMIRELSSSRERTA